MADKIPEAAKRIADGMIHKYGNNGIYQEIIEQITNRASITLRQIKN